MSFNGSQLGFEWGERGALLVREEWISACRFSELGEVEVLDAVSDRVKKNRSSVVLLDLDSTLYDVGHRTHRIFIEWAESSVSRSFSGVRSAFLRMPREALGYSVRDTFKNLGLTSNSREFVKAHESVKKFWFRRFFTSEYLKWDRPYPGAASFAQVLHQRGAQIVYLTGRDEPNMGAGTRQNLNRDGFPWGLARTHLLMKPSFHLDDLLYKRSATEDLHRRGTLVASFENEPPNVVALSEQFPDAMHIFVDTVCSETPTRVKHGLFKIPGNSAFERFVNRL